MSGTVFINEFFYVTDHLGNNRLTVRNNSGDAVIVNKTDYYPFGSVAREWTNTTPDIGKFKYQQKERDLETGYDYFEARIYDSQTGRFLQVDPMAEKFNSMSPFSAMGNSPVYLIDPDGEEIIIHYEEDDVDDNGKVRKDKDGKTIKVPKTFIYKPGQEYTGGNGFVAGVVGQLNEAFANGTDEIRSVISTLSSTEEGSLKHDISEKTSGSSITDPKNEEDWYNNLPTGSNVKYNSSEAGTVGIVHELSHMYDNQMGQANFDVLPAYENSKLFRSNSPLDMTELNAVSFENHYRKKNNMNLRTDYGGVAIREGHQLLRRIPGPGRQRKKDLKK